jgi:hypothetical protein
MSHGGCRRLGRNMTWKDEIYVGVSGHIKGPVELWPVGE